MSFWDTIKSWFTSTPKAVVEPAPAPPEDTSKAPAPPSPIVGHPISKTSVTPWMDWLKMREGFKESSPSQNAALSKGWKYVGLDYKTISGSDHAWCAMALNSALIESGYKGNGSAAAVSFRTYGDECGFVYGAILPITHASGAHHVTTFVEWVDEDNHIAACLGGNQSNALQVSHYNLSGNAHDHDQVIPSPRWPKKV